MSKDEEDTGGGGGGGGHAACQAVREHTRVHTQGMAQTHKQVQTTACGPPTRGRLSLMFLHTHTHTLPNPVPVRTQGSMRPARPPPLTFPTGKVWLPLGPWGLFTSTVVLPHFPGDFAQMPPSPQASQPPPSPPPSPAESMTLLHWAFPPRHGGLFHFSLPGGDPQPQGLHPQGSTSPWNRWAQSRPSTAQHRVGGDGSTELMKWISR